MSKIWSFMIIISIVFALIYGNADMIIVHITKASTSAVENVITLTAMLCFWSGIFNVLKSTNITGKISRLIKPIINKLFKHEEIDNEICEDAALNITSNILGVGNAATVFGIKTIKKMNELNTNKDKANDSMTTFVLLNTTSIQLIPTTIISLRMLYGSKEAGRIILPVWIMSILALAAGLFTIKVLNRVIK